MRHAILGAGGVGGLVAAALARSGQEVLLIVRPERLAAQPAAFEVRSRVLGDFTVRLSAAPRLEPPADVLWITVKATQLEAALALAPPAAAGSALVVPLLNGIDHVARLREVYDGRVVPGAIRVESERVGARIIQPTPFADVELAPPPELRPPAGSLAAEVAAAGLGCLVRESEARVLWSKLALLAPLALTTTAGDCAIGEARERPELRELLLACAREVCAVAAGEGAELDPERYRQTLLAMPAGMRSSMQKDVEAGRPPELDAIAVPVIRRGRERGVPTPATEELRRRVAGRMVKR